MKFLEPQRVNELKDNVSNVATNRARLVDTNDQLLEGEDTIERVRVSDRRQEQAPMKAELGNWTGQQNQTNKKRLSYLRMRYNDPKRQCGKMMATVGFQTAASFAVLLEEARKKDKVRGEQSGAECFPMTRKRGSNWLLPLPVSLKINDLEHGS